MTSLRSVLSRALAVALLATAGGAIAPSAVTAQKALVYCPASIDVAGCDNAITALGTDFPGGVDRGYDGSSGTMDMRTIDLWSYAVIVIPSLADGSGGLPYAFLRDTAVSGKLHAAIMGRIALWSGTPDQGTTNRAAKNALLQSLARWAQGNYATVKGPGLVALQDLSDTVSHRYDWLHAITGLTITADSAVYTYASVGAVTATGTAILTDATGATIAYTNMASLGFFLPQGAAGLHLDAVGQTGTSQGGQVVLATSPGGNTGTAVIATDKDDYAPGATVTITGHGFQPGETVTISLLESPNLDQHTPLTSVADASGNFVNTSFSPDAHDVSVRFIITAVGATSRMQAEATFTDGNVTAVHNTAVFASTTTANACSATTPSSFVIGTKYCGQTTILTTSGGGTLALFLRWVRPDGTASTCATSTTSATAGTSWGLDCTPDVGGTWKFQAATNSNFNINSILDSAKISVSAVLATTMSVGATSPSPATFSTSAQSVTLSATISASSAVNGGTVTFTVKDAGNNTIGSPVTSAAVSGGSATASYSLPASTPVGSYSVNAQYSGTSGFGSSSGTGSLSIAKAAQAAVTLTGVPTTAQAYQATFTIGASGGSGTGAYSFASTGVCSVDATTGLVTMTSGTGTCSLTASRAADNNYNASAPSAASSVTAALALQAALNVTGMPATAQTFGAQFTVGASGGSGTGSVSFTASGACSVNASSGLVSITSGTGTCSVTASKSGDTNYAPITSSAATVSAAKAAQVIAWTAPAPITYGTSLTGVLNASITTGDGTLSYDHTASEIPTPGTLTITATASATANYNSATSQITLTINKATLTPNVTAQNKVYDGTTAAQASGTLAGVVGSDVVTLGIGSATFADRNVGTGKTVTVTGLTLGGAQSGFYLLSTTTATATADITRAPLTITASSPASIVYGSPAPAVTPSFSAFATGDDASAVTGLTCGTTYVAGNDVGSYATTCSGGTAANYSLGYTPGSFSVTKAPLSVTANDKSRVYGSANPPLDGTLTGVFGSDGITASYATTAVQGSNVGTYPITPSLADPNNRLGNYLVASTNGTLTITKAPLSVTAANASREYGDANPSFAGTLSGVVNNDAITATYASPADPTSNVGTYAITPSLNDPGSRLGNYSVTSTNGTLTITAAPLSVTPANAQRLYGGSNPTFTGTVTGIKNNDPITASYATTATSASVVGPYDITATLADPSSKLGNYVVTLNKGVLTVNPAPLTVKADDATRMYGDANPAFTGTLSGVVNNDNIGASYGSAADATSNVGTYAITPTLSDPASRLGNYTVTSTNGTLTVTQAPLSVTPGSAQRLYGASNPTFTGTVTGIKNNDPITASYTTTANASSPVGPYDITATLADPSTKLGNYAVTLNKGVLTVNPAPLTVTADDASRTYGAANPSFTVHYTGFVLNETSAVLGGTLAFTTSATPASSVGTYPVTPSGVTATNYAITFADGTLTVTPAPLTVKADDATRLYGDANPAFTGTLTGIQNSDPITATYATTAVPASNVGGYAITPSLADPSGKLSNYSVTSTNGTLTITQAPLTIAAANASRTYGAQNPTFTGTITGLKNSDAITATYASTATVQSHVGTYAITPTAVDQSPAKLANYTVTLTNGTLTISQATPTITWAQPASIPQGTALSATQLNATASGVFNETVSGSFAYTPAAGTILYTVGSAALSTTFTSSNTDYTGATKANSVQVSNVAPTVTSITLGSAPVPVNQSVSLQAAFTDPGINDTWTAQITWDDGTTSAGTVSNGTVSASHTFTTAGVYTITVAVSDNNGGTGTRVSSSDLVGYIVVYDPSAGFVTGGGWINSPSGACRLTTICGTATGKANFGFNARYQKGANVPDGTTEFQFQAGGLNFHSTVYQWLVVSGTKAQYKGSGTVNGVAGYGFLLTAIDGTQKGNPDAFRIKITDTGGNVVYDNQMGSLDDSSDATTLGGGSIVIH